MKLEKPKVSIIMATYNRAHFIVETLQSIQNQTYKNWECLIIDDGGTDNTKEVINPFLENDTRFKFYKRPKEYVKGLPGARNYGIDIANGDFIIFFDDDDIVHPQNLEICVYELNNSKDIFFCRYIRRVFTEEFNVIFELDTNYSKFFIDSSDIKKLITHELPFNSCQIMWKKECFINNRFVESLMYAEEWELYSRILSQNVKGISVNKCLFYGRKHENSNTGEFYKKNLIRLNSKKEAISLVFKNLIDKKMLNDEISKYLFGLTLSLRDKNLTYEIIEKSKISIIEQFFLKFKYVFFPVWRTYKRLMK